MTRIQLLADVVCDTQMGAAQQCNTCNAGFGDYRDPGAACLKCGDAVLHPVDIEVRALVPRHVARRGLADYEPFASAPGRARAARAELPLRRTHRMSLDELYAQGASKRRTKQ